LINATTILYANSTVGMPIIDPACDSQPSYMRSQPTRIHLSTESFPAAKLQHQERSMNGDSPYTTPT